MAKIGVYSNNAEAVIVQKMKVPRGNIFSMQESQKAVDKIQTGDTLCVASIVNIFSSVGALKATMEMLMSRSCEFASCNEKKLSFNAIRQLQPSVRQTIQWFADTEVYMESTLNKCKMDYGQRAWALGEMRKNQVLLLAHIMNNDTHYYK